ncbi:MAG TPA: DUF1580 domain-containing protein [Phycisphaerae bacterium]|nr:DUF1580 domain-containing protein [Phycisphaerae bacterium]
MRDAATADPPLVLNHPHAVDPPLARCLGPDEELITLAAAARRLPRIDGKKIAIPTIWRWCRRGLRGVRLQYTRVGRRICVSPSALSEFFSRLAELDERLPPPGRPAFLGKRTPITSRQRQRALAEADGILERAGI